MENGIKPVDPRDRTGVEEIVRLHSLLLPQSPVARLGPAFMRRFYYQQLIRDGLVCADLYYSDGIAAGFIAYTKHAADFMAKGLQRHWLRLAGVVAGAILRRPLLLGEILRVFLLMRRRKQQSDSVLPAEILSFGVLPAYRSAEFVRRTGQRISLELFESARDYFDRHNLPSLRMLVETENRQALLFYHALGCEFRPQVDKAAKTVEVIYTRNPVPEAAEAGVDAEANLASRKKVVNTST